jgi:hypothetical protein
MFEKIIRFNFSVLICPCLLSQEEFLGISPRLHLNKLFSIFAKTLWNQLIWLTNFNTVEIVAIRSHTSNVDNRGLNRSCITLLDAWGVCIFFNYSWWINLIRIFLFDLNLFGVAKVPEEHPLWAVDQAVVTVLKLTDFALVKGAIPEVEALVALVLDVAVRFLEQKLGIWEIVQSLTME